jgi:hypothetical protein
MRLSMQRHPLLALLVVTTGAIAARAAFGISLTDATGVTRRGEPVEFHGDIVKPKNVSGVAAVGDLLVIVSDEMKDKTVAQVLRKDGDTYRLLRNVELPAGNGEVDLEAVAAEGNVVYLTGSHSATRKITGTTFERPKPNPSREQFFRFRLNDDGSHGPVEGPKSLAPRLDADPVLAGFRAIASKENGIDIEGLAVKDGQLYFGFRGPVLRDGWVPILVTSWDDVGRGRVRYVQLDGRGIRDIAAVDGGFLILAGPVGDGDETYRIYLWSGADQLSAQGDARPRRVAEFSDLDGGKPEGLAVLRTRDTTYEILVVCDGLPQGGPTRWMLRPPP